MLKIAMVVPPLSNLNTPYAAAPRLGGWLRQLGHEVQQIDLSLEVFLRIFSRAGLERMFAAVDPRKIVGETEDVYHNRDRYLRVIDDAIALLQGRDPSLAYRFARGDVLPEGPRFRRETPADRRARFGAHGKLDLARHMATLMLNDLVELFRQTVSPHLELLKYAAKLVNADASFDALDAALRAPPGPVEEIILEAAGDLIAEDVDLVCFTVPFPGQLMGGLLVGKWLASRRPRAARAMGGGFPSTELRGLSDPRFFDHIDYLVLDDGEVPLRQLCQRLEGADVPLHRTFTRSGGKVVWHAGDECQPLRFRDLPAPDYRGLDMGRYVHLITGQNPVFRLSSEGPWLKLTAAHGCYWKKCTFCDIHLSYIGDFDPLPASDLADQMDRMHDQTGLSSFHFTDEAAPPPLLVNLALELLRRDRSYQFWGNIRFDPGFTPDRCRLLAAAGMIAVTGGIEVASDEILPKIAKGITVPQVTKVLQAFSDAGIMTHAYLIYGFPGETVQDTINSLEILRQLMRAGLLMSGYYHVFGVTSYSPIARDPELFGIKLKPFAARGFGDYHRDYESLPGAPPPPTGAMWEILNKVIDSYSAGKDLDRAVTAWFKPGEVPAPTVSARLVEELMGSPFPDTRTDLRLCWLGGTPRWERGMLTVSCADGTIYTASTPRVLADRLGGCHPAGWRHQAPPRHADAEIPAELAPLRARGLVLV